MQLFNNIWLALKDKITRKSIWAFLKGACSLLVWIYKLIRFLEGDDIE
ncbi:MAG: hypothetical protein V7784_16805 [Oceanospirillaceae bacterium]